MSFVTLLLVTVLQTQDAFSFSPNVGPLAGGIEVQFRTSSLDWRFGTPQVFFGGVASPQVTVISATG